MGFSLNKSIPASISLTRAAMALKLVSDTLAKVNSFKGSDGAKTVSTALSVTGGIITVGEEFVVYQFHSQTLKFSNRP